MDRKEKGAREGGWGPSSERGEKAEVMEKRWRTKQDGVPEAPGEEGFREDAALGSAGCC